MLTQSVRCSCKTTISAVRTLKYSTVIDNTKPEGWEEAMPYNSIPGPTPLPLIGNLWMFLPIIGPLHKMTPLNLHKKLYNDYGKIVRFGTVPSRPSVMVYDPKDMETVFRNEGIYPIRESAHLSIGYYRDNVRKDVFQGINGLMPMQGKEWYDFRSKVNPILMHPQTIYQYTKSINLITNDLLDIIRKLAVSNHKKEMPANFMDTIYSWTFENMAYIALDKRIGCLSLHLHETSEAARIINNVINFFQGFGELEFQPAYRNIYKTKLWKDYVESADFLTFTFLKYINEAEASINKEAKSALQQLLKLDRKVATTMVMDMLIAGVDTSGKQTASVLFYLAKNQRAQDTLRKELLKLLPYKDSLVTKEIIAQAPYLKAVIKETERIIPCVPGTMRKTPKDIVLSGYQVPKGITIFTCHCAASNLEENYPRAAEFLPERWLRTTTGELSYKNTNQFVTLPFGFGPRSCVGKRIARLEMEIGIAKIIRNFKLEWNQKDPTFDGWVFVGITDPLKFQFYELDC